MQEWQDNKNAVLPTASTVVAVVGILFADSLLAVEPESRDSVEEIVVTGSRIPRRDFTTPSPLTTVDDVEIRLSGTTTIEDTLDTLPQVVPGLDRSANNPGSGQATVNLRGLGAKRTLVLLNGRRFISGNTEGSVDLNNIPSALIERVEVVTGGASAVYGSDAIAGAVNFILKSDYQGIQAQVQYDKTEEGDGDVFDASITAGTRFAGDSGTLTGFLAYHDRSSILQGDREFSSTAIGEDPFSGEIFPAGSIRTPEGLIPNVVDIAGVPAPDGITFNSDGSPRPFLDPADLYNFAPPNFLQVPLERWTAALLANVEFSTGINAYAESLFVDSQVTQQLAPTLNPRQVEMNLDNPFVHPDTRQVFEDYFDPDGDGIAEFIFNKRFLELGPRKIEDDSQMLRLVLGFSGPLLGDWTWDAHALYSTADYDETFDNNASFGNFRQSLLVDPATRQCLDTSDGCVPANIFGAGNISPEAANFIRVPPVSDSYSSTEKLLNASVVGDVPAFWGRSLGFAVGVEWREDESEFSPAPERASGDILSFFPTSAVSSTVRMTELFGEVLLPVLVDQKFAEELSFEAGFRYTDHDVVGSFDTWKLGGQWSPINGVTLRGSVQEAVRAPNSKELFEGEQIFGNPFIAEFDDLCSNEADRNPADLGLVDVCVAQGIPAGQIGTYQATPFFRTEVIAGGNPGLEAESSDTTTFGIVFEPKMWPSVSISLDYYSISIDNAVQELSGSDVVLGCFILNDPDSDLCRSVQRNDPSLNITDVAAGPKNIAKLETEGIDLQVTASFDLPGAVASTLDFRFLGTHTLENGAQTDPNVPFIECAGFFGFPCDMNSFGTLPDYKTQTRLTYRRDPLAVSLQWSWVSGMDSAFYEYSELLGIPPEILIPGIADIGDEHYLSLSLDYDFRNGVGVYGGVHNLTDNDPPLMAGSSVQANTDPSLYDVYGRRYFVGVSASFGN